jgi:putative ABC transport system substrate-binding protein
MLGRLTYASSLILALAVLLAPGTLAAQKACAVLSSDITPYREAMEGFRQSFKGQVQQLVMPAEAGRAGEIVAQIEGAGCSVVVAMGSNALKFLRLRMTSKPIVFAMTLSPTSEGISGLNITGVFLEPSPSMSLAAIRKVFPSARRIAALYSRSSQGYMDAARREAQAQGIGLIAMPAPTTGDAIRAVAVAMTQADVIWMIPDIVTSAQAVFEAMLDASLRNNVPIFALAGKHVSAGALAALSTDYGGNGRQAGALAQRIAAGSQASAIAPEYSTDAGIVLNLRTARRMGISVPDSVISQAVEVYR